MNKWILSALIIGMFFSGFAIGQLQLTNFGHRDPRFSANVFIVIENAQGKQTFSSGNVMTTLFENAMRDTFAWYNNSVVPNATNQTKYISTGNLTAASSSITKLTTEAAENGFTRATGTVSAWQNGTHYAYNVTYKFTCATGAETINGTGLQWFATSASDGNLVADASIATTAFAIADTCTITWVITFVAN